MQSFCIKSRKSKSIIQKIDLIEVYFLTLHTSQIILQLFHFQLTKFSSHLRPLSYHKRGTWNIETKMYVMAVPKIESYLGTIERYETMFSDEPLTARATPKQAHDIVVKNLPINLDKLHKTGLFSDIRLYNREGVKLLFKFRNAFH